MTFLRSTLDNSNGMIGPDMAIPIANIETNQPAVEIVTSNCLAISGIKPIKPISVFNIPKTPIVRMNIMNLLFFKSIRS